MADVKRYLTYDDQDEPLLVLEPTRPREANRQLRFAIRMADLWQYSEEHNPHFERFMGGVALQVHELFDLGLVTPRKMADIAAIIQEGIDDMMKMPPRPVIGKRVVGELDYSETPISGDGAGQRFETQVTEDEYLDENEEQFCHGGKKG